MSTKLYDTTPKTHILNSLVSAELPNGAVSALSEFIDNSLGEGAGKANNVIIRYKEKDFLTIIDDGAGVENIAALFTLGDSQSRLKNDDIGNFGYGAKVGALFMGWHVTVHTVRNGEYQMMEVDWKKISKSQDWPKLSVISTDIKKAPSIINEGGTMIQITDLHPKQKWKISGIATKLAHTYNPALKAGKKITLEQYNASYGSMAKIELSSTAFVKLKDRTTFSGEVDGMPFTVIAGRNVEGAAIMNAIHLGFGHRIIRSVTSLPGQALPPSLYVEVSLGKEWKKQLTATKNNIQNYNKYRLLDKIELGLAKLLKKLNTAQQQYRLDVLSGVLAGGLNSALKNASIKKDPESDTAETKPRKPRKPSDIDDSKKKELNGINLKFNDDMGLMAYDVATHGKQVTITLNSSIPYIKTAIKAPMNVSCVWALISGGLLDFIFEDVDKRHFLIQGLKQAIEESGNDMSFIKTKKQETLVTFLESVPLVQEPTPTELKNVS